MAAAAYLIVHKAVVHKHSPAPTPIVQTSSKTTSHTTGTTHVVSLKSKFYVVQPNDTLSKIAAETGVSVSTIEALNPRVNPNALHASQKLLLRR